MFSVITHFMKVQYSNLSVQAYKHTYIMLDQLQEGERSKSIAIRQISKLYKDLFEASSNAVYYPYNNDVRDVGWGCAWRAIQTLLSNYHIFISFAELYNTFSKKTLLMAIARNKSLPENAISWLEKNIWAPQQLDNHWAEPFIASLICQYYKLPTQLLLLNGYPQAYAPKEVFPKVINFSELFQIIKNNTKNSTIMIDDGHYALSIVGWRQVNPQTIQLLFADPHIKNNRDHIDVGLYRKSFNLAGKSIENDIRSQVQRKEALYNVYDSLEFQTKAWMICAIVL